MIRRLIKEIVLVTGPVKSGKSLWAEKLASKSKEVTYIATHSTDYKNDLWIKRIEKHKERRANSWKLIESPDLVNVIDNLNPDSTLLIDSIGGVVTEYLDFLDSSNSKQL